MVLNERDRQIEAIYHLALEKPAGRERQSYLDSACGEDAELRAAVEGLLKAHDGAGDFLEVPPVAPVVTLDTPPISEGPGTVIGRYKLLEQIGEGGFGVVYMADQTEPIHRRVALKIIKLGMDTKEVIARFEAERQALAMMDHPNIAKVFDAGATDTGRPFFVMELVKGIPITEYCDKNNLDTEERLRLFVGVCKAIQHAHQKGIIHRDLKPSNVMITLHDGRPVPKVIDFGIAKATGQRLTEKTLFTRFAQMIGTPEYMSPEQAEFSGLDVDTRSDIYSLGVLVYELLTGATPFDGEKLREAGYSEMQRIIREEEPDKPSTKLSTMGEALTGVAKHRKVSPELLPKLVRGDLDWIVMKTLEKDRTRRYETASELAADIERHLADELVLAGPPRAGYRLGKFVRRNRIAVMASLLIAAALLAVAVISAMYAREATLHARDVAIHANKVENARRNAVKAQQETARLLARSYVDRAQALCEQGEVGRGMLWLADSLKIASDDSTDLDRAVRTSLAGWYSQLHSLRAVVKWSVQINFVTYSPDGLRILLGCQDGTARCCSGATGQPIGEPLRHGSAVGSVVMSPDGKWMATRGMNGSIRLWDALTFDPIGELMQHEQEGTWQRGCMVFSPDSSRLITGGNDGAVRTWDVATGRALGRAFQYKGEVEGSVQAIAFCPNGLRVLLRIGQEIYQMFDADRGEAVGPPVDVGSEATAVAISSDGVRFAIAKFHSMIQVWEAATGKPVCEPIVRGGIIYSLAFSPDGSRILSSGNTRVAMLWDAATGAVIGSRIRQRATVNATAFSPNGTSIVTSNLDGEVQVWNLSMGKHVARPVRHEDLILGAVYGPDGLLIFTETDGAIRIRDAVTGQIAGKSVLSHRDRFHSFAIRLNGSRLVIRTSGTTTTARGVIQLWDIATGELVGESSNPVFGKISFSPDGSRILGGGRDGTVWLWDSATMKCIGTLAGHQQLVYTTAFSPDGSQFLSGSYDGTTQLWDTATLQPIGELMVGHSEVQDLGFSPDGTKIVIGYADGTVRLRDAMTRKLIGAPLEHMDVVSSVAFNPDGSLILACFISRMSRFWDAATLKPVGPPLEHDSWWPRASFSPDGSEILIVDWYGTTTVWPAPPAPLQGEYERIVCWVQVVTGLELDPTGGINVLDAPTWQQRCLRLQELGGPPESISRGL